MQDELDLSVEDLLAQLKRKGIPLPAEIGAFIALESCEQIDGAPVRLTTRDVWLGEIGEIMVVPPAQAASEHDAVYGVVRLLGDLLVCAAPGVSPMFLELVEQGPSAGEWTLSRLRGDLEACLMPLNRGATRRVLARLLRELHRGGERNSLRPSGAPNASELDAQLDALLGGADVEPSQPAASSLQPMAAATQQPVARVINAGTKVDHARAPEPTTLPGIEVDTDDDDVTLEDEPTTAPIVSAPTRPAAPRVEAEALSIPQEKAPAKTKTSAPKLDLGEDLFEGEPQPRSGGAVIGGIFVLIAVVLAIAYATLGQLGARKLLGLTPPEQSAAPPMAAKAPTAAAVGELRVSTTPANAQVFLLVGAGPALATDLPLGIAHEFVALAEGHAPARALVPQDAAWEDSPTGSRYELAMQTGRAATGDDTLELGATLLPPKLGTPQAKTGTVRVITTPPGAKVYQLIGFTPAVHVENLALDRGYDLLIYAPGYSAELRHLEAGDFQAQGAARVAALDLTLRKRLKH